MYKTKIIILTLSIILALTILIYAQENSSKKLLHQKYSQALYLIGAKQYDQAIEKLKKIIETNPEMEKAYSKIAQVYRKKKNDTEAIAYFQDLLIKNPTNAYINHTLGWIYLVTGEYNKALEFCQKSIELNPNYADGVKDYVNVQQKLKKLDNAENYLENMLQLNPQNAFAYYGLGYIYQLQYNWEKTLQNIEKALKLKNDLLLAYITKQAALWYTSNYQEFLETSQQAYKLAKEKKDVEFQVNFLTNIGLAHSHFSNNDEALKSYQQALEIAKKIGYRKEVMRISGNMGTIYRDTGELGKAVASFERSYSIAHDMENRRHQGLQLRNMGDCYHFMGKYKIALDHFQKAAPIIKSLGDKHLQSLLYWSLGLLNTNYGNHLEGLVYNQQALSIAIQQKDKWGIARYLNAIGLNYWNLGNYTKALDCFKKSLPITREIGDKFGEELTIGNTGIIYQELGDFSNALKYYNEALKIAREINNKKEEMRHLANIGTVHSFQKDFNNSFDFYNQALEMSRGFRDKRQESILLSDIGDNYTILEKYEQARKYINNALSLSDEINDKSTQAAQLINLGDVNKSTGNYNEAFKCYHEANQIGIMINEPCLIWRSFMGLGICYDIQKKYQQSLRSYEYAITEIEKIRQSIATDKFKTGFFENKIQLFVNVIELLDRLNQKYPSKNYDKQAFLCAEKAKARTLLDIVFEGKIFQNLAEIPVDFRQKFLINEKSFNNKHQELSNELSKSESSQNKQLVFDLNNQIETLQREKTKILLELQQKYPRYFKLTNPSFFSVQEVQKNILKQDQIIFEYLVGEKKTYIWIISKNNMEFKTIELSKNELQTKLAKISPIFEKEKKTVETKIDHRWANFDVGLLHELYLKLLGKPAAKLLNNKKELIIIPDGLLFYFPFEILVTEIEDKKINYLIEKYSISYSSSSSLLNPELKKDGNPQYDFLAFGNPDFKSKKKKGILEHLSALIKYRPILRGTDFQQLPNAELEVKVIAENFKSPAVFTGKKADEARLKLMAKDFKFIHLASHFLIDDTQPMYSKVILSQSNKEIEDGFLQTYEVCNMRLNADMVVLSGCNSGLGKLSRGEGLIGLTRAFLYAGVPSIIVSLWSVDDESTAQLMKKFYKYLIAGLNKNQALQKAKIDLIKSKDKKSDPFYWAPFVLIGDSEQH